jgi:hypothetical protein
MPKEISFGIYFEFNIFFSGHFASAISQFLSLFVMPAVEILASGFCQPQPHGPTLPFSYGVTDPGYPRKPTLGKLDNWTKAL